MCCIVQVLRGFLALHPFVSLLLSASPSKPCLCMPEGSVLLAYAAEEQAHKHAISAC